MLIKSLELSGRIWLARAGAGLSTARGQVRQFPGSKPGSRKPGGPPANPPESATGDCSTAVPGLRLSSR